MKYLLILLTLAGCGADTSEQLIVVIGDSISAGLPVTKADPTHNEYGQVSYELEQITGMKTINQGIGGTETSHTLARFDHDAIQLGATIVWLHVGYNDFYHEDTTEEQTIQNFTAIITKAHNAGIRLFVDTIGRPPQDSLHPDKSWAKYLATERVNSWLKQQANITVLDFDEHFAHGYELDDTRVPDKIHPSKAGYSEWGKIVANAVSH